MRRIVAGRSLPFCRSSQFNQYQTRPTHEEYKCIAVNLILSKGGEAKGEATKTDRDVTASPREVCWSRSCRVQAQVLLPNEGASVRRDESRRRPKTSGGFGGNLHSFRGRE